MPYKRGKPLNFVSPPSPQSDPHLAILQEFGLGPDKQVTQAGLSRARQPLGCSEWFKHWLMTEPGQPRSFLELFGKPLGKSLTL